MIRATRAIAILGAVVFAAPLAYAKGDDDDDEEEDDDSDDEDADDDAPAKKPKKKSSDDDDGGKKDKKPKKEEPEDFKKQDLTGHDLAGTSKSNLFEKDRFFADKVDTKKSAKGTLVQGSLTSTSFAYRESGSALPGDAADAASNSQFSRVFTDLRLQTDFRHISGGNWDARVDVRGRGVVDPGTSGNYVSGFEPTTNSSSQSGFLGENELEIRELWLARSGERTDYFLGRQFVADLAGVRFDGMRFDYASSSKFTLLGFGGLYPIRGSRSITTDYQPLLSLPDNNGARSSAGRFTGTGGFGAAYRTQNMYGAFGGVTMVPFSSEQPRVFGTSTGYWRVGPKLDFYHFGVIDVLGSSAGITNLSAGLNIKPDQRLRGTLSFNRVDTETLNVQAQAFLADPEMVLPIVQNEAFLLRVAQNQARASLSAGLGSLQRFEVTVASAFRYRGELDLTAPNGTVVQTLPAGKSGEVYGSLTDRRSVANLRLGVDGSRIFRVGDATYQRTEVLAMRAFAARELANGHGEWEAEISYASSRDDSAGKMCVLADIDACYGSAKSKSISAGGNIFYRINTSWFALGGIFLTRSTITSTNSGVLTADPPVTGVSGFFRAAYRF